MRVGEDHINLQGLIGERPLERDTDIRIDAHTPDLNATLKNFASGRIRHQDSHFAVQT